jgi:polyhydroxybutyrate depolymerase
LRDAKGSSTTIAQSTKLGTLAPQRGFVAVFPDGLRQQWNFFPPGKEPESFVKDSKASGGVPDDGAFLKGLVDDLVRSGIADPRRVYVVGESNGGLMALRMLCTDANLFAGAALLAAAMGRGACD